MKIAVIPARGGSKRIPRKNIKLFNGKPVIAYSIQAALECDLFDHVIVSTDDEEIAGIATKLGAEVPFMRPEPLADDHTGTNAVTKHAIEWYQENNQTVSYACCIYSTAPLIQPKYLQEGLNILIDKGKSFSFSVSSYSFPYQRAVKIKDDGIEALFPDLINKRSQDLAEAYHDAGQFYWGTAKAFLNEHELMSSSSAPVLVPRHFVQDIDTTEDWIQAELMHKALELSKK